MNFIVWAHNFAIIPLSLKNWFKLVKYLSPILSLSHCLYPFVCHTGLGCPHYAEEIPGTWLFVGFFSYPWLLSIYPISGNYWPNFFFLLLYYQFIICLYGLCNHFLLKNWQWIPIWYILAFSILQWFDVAFGRYCYFFW